MNYIKCPKCGKEEPAFDYAHVCGPIEVKRTVMNERIRELAEQAGMYIVDDEFSTYGKFAEKFAELIVKECANHCDLLLDHNISSEWSRGTHDCSRAIKKHFGVEE